MTFYTPESLLEEARLRIDSLPPGLGVIIVEGDDDKTLIARYAIRPEQIIACDGKEVLTRACVASRSDACEGAVFLRDCDYDVPTGVLNLQSSDLPKGALVVSQRSDIESDLVGMGLLRDVVGTLRPSALASDQMLQDLVNKVLAASVSIAELVGRLRFASAKHDLCLGFGDLSMSKIAREGMASLLNQVEARSRDAMMARGLRREDLVQLADEAPRGLAVCNGHDLIGAIAYVLQRRYNVRGQRAEHIGVALRLALRESDLRQWVVGKRIRAWEDRSGRRILAP
jgi:hypothetical protein